jgi:hypothetical protein
MQQYREFTPICGKWGPTIIEKKKKTKLNRKKKKGTNSHVKYYISSEELQSPSNLFGTHRKKTGKKILFPNDQVSIIHHDRTSLHLEQQHERPDSVDTDKDNKKSPPSYNQYSSVTTMAEMKRVRHSRRYFATNGDHSIEGRRRLRQPAPVNGIPSRIVSGIIITDETPPPSAGTVDTRSIPTIENVDKTLSTSTTRDLKHQLPPSSLSTAFLRLHAKEKEQASLPPSSSLPPFKKKHHRTTPKPRNDHRGSILPKVLPKWKQMLTYSSGVERKVKTPLSFPSFGSIIENNNFNQYLTNWEDLSRKRTVAREQNKKHQSWLIANNCTYIERLEHARSYYKKTIKKYYYVRWNKRIRYMKGIYKIYKWKINILQLYYTAWNIHINNMKKKNRIYYSKHSTIIQKWWKKNAVARRYVRNVKKLIIMKKHDKIILKNQLNTWQKKLRGIIFVIYISKYIWGGKMFTYNTFLHKIKKSLNLWHLWALKEKTIRRYLYFTNRSSHGLMCSEIKRAAARSRQRRRIYAATTIQCNTRCYYAKKLICAMRLQNTRLKCICSKFGMATNKSLILYNFNGWKRVIHVEKTLKKIYKRICGSLLELMFEAWSIEAMKQFYIEKVEIVTKIQSYYRGRSARNKVDVQKRQMEFDKTVQERKLLKNKILMKKDGDDGNKMNSNINKNDSNVNCGDTIKKKTARGYFSDSSTSDDDDENNNDNEINLIVIEEFGQDMTDLKNLTSRYILLQTEIERMLSTLSRFDQMYKQAREYVMDLGYEMKNVRKILKDQRKYLSEHQESIKKLLRDRSIISKKNFLTDIDMKNDLKLSKLIKMARIQEDVMLKEIHKTEDKERHLQSKYVDEHRAMSDEKQNSAVYFDTRALSWNTNDNGNNDDVDGNNNYGNTNDEIKRNSNTIGSNKMSMKNDSEPSIQRFPMRTEKQRTFLEVALRQGLVDVGSKIRTERKTLKIKSRVLRRKQRALERECLEQLLYLSVGNGNNDNNGDEDQKYNNKRGILRTSGTFKFTRMLSDPDPKKTASKVQKACLEWKTLLSDGWLPATKIASWIASGLLDPSIPLRSRVIAFRCVREVFGEEDQVMAEIAFQLMSKNSRSSHHH